MGKASSAKKVARAARAGGRVSSGQPRSLLFPGVILLVVVLGTALVVFARHERNQDDLGGVPQLGDHIHQAFAVNVCGEFKADIPEFESPVGIHTHGDGVLHIHPFSQLGVGKNATLGRFFSDAEEGSPPVDVTIADDEVTWLGEEIVEGETECDGVEDPIWRLAYWEDVQSDEGEPTVTTGDFADTRLTDNGAGLTLFYGDPEADIPKPPTASNLAELGAIDADPSATTTTTAAEGETDGADGSTTTTAAGGTTSSTVADTTSSSTSTTAAG